MQVIANNLGNIINQNCKKKKKIVSMRLQVIELGGLLM